jgi:flagellar motor switch/type III secretory pathway protein FliN
MHASVCRLEMTPGKKRFDNMSSTPSEIQDALAANCRARAAEVLDALSQALGLKISEFVGVEQQSLEDVVIGQSAPGLVLASMVNSAALLLAIPNVAEMLPTWCAAPDQPGSSRLIRLGHRLALLLLPDELAAQESRYAWSPNVGEAIERARLPTDTLLSLKFKTAEDQVCQIIVGWPAQNPAALLGQTSKSTLPASGQGSAIRQPPRPAPPVRRTPTLRDLPSYSRSLLKIEVPVVVTLASKRQPLGRIVELGPGSIIHFNKSCEEMLDLEVGGQSVAQGEPIKVGDKFGIRLTSLVLPSERFVPLAKPAS